MKRHSSAIDEDESLISERDFGIRMYMSPDIPGFSAVLKQRYSDFLVNEIDKSGKMVVLENAQDAADLIDTGDNNQNDTKIAYSSDKLLNIIGNEGLIVQIGELAKGNASQREVIIPVRGLDKNVRKQIHEEIRMFSGDSLESQTLEDGIHVKRSKSTGKRSAKYKKIIEFTLYKENRETMDVISNISRALKVPTKCFGFAGTKDRRGITQQKITSSGVIPEKFNGINEYLKDKNIVLGDFKFVSEPLKLGDLRGNHFKLVLRSVKCSDVQLGQLAKNIKYKGFINYFGMQRFGTGDVPTYVFGKYILKSEWKKFVEILISSGSRRQSEEIRREKIKWLDGLVSHENLLEMLPRRNVAERVVLTKLKDHPSQYLQAIQAIPRNLRLMYVHAYQSFIWNFVASGRVEKLGRRVCVGDLVIPREQALSPRTLGETNKTAILVETEDQASKYELWDIVLPLPGHSVIYPSNKTWDLYIEMMEKDGLRPDDMTRNVTEFSMNGDYRYLFVKPTDFDMSTRHYDDDLIPILSGKSETQNIIPDNIGKKKAIILEFTLNPSEYATMLVREVMKTDTAVSHQMTLNDSLAGGHKP